jgi:hypothetical protein
MGSATSEYLFFLPCLALPFIHSLSMAAKIHSREHLALCELHADDR